MYKKICKNEIANPLKERERKRERERESSKNIQTSKTSILKLLKIVPSY